MTVTIFEYEIGFKNDNKSDLTTVIGYLSPKDNQMRYFNTNTEKCHKSWELMAIEEYRSRGLEYDRVSFYVNLIWNLK